MYSFLLHERCRSNQKLVSCVETKSINGKPAVYFDGPGASQMPKRVYRAYTDHVLNDKANAGGYFETSVNTTRSS